MSQPRRVLALLALVLPLASCGRTGVGQSVARAERTPAFPGAWPERPASTPTPGVVGPVPGVAQVVTPSATPAAPMSDRRVALVVGNARYAAGALKNPVNDARAVTKILEHSGFEVESIYDGSFKEMKRGIHAFGEKLGAGGVGLFYYAGHAIQLDARNYLVPTDASIRSEPDVEVEGVPLAAVLAKMDAASNTLNIVILDACRNNPFATSHRSLTRGLALVDAPRGTLIAYATAPGSVAEDGDGDNSVFSAALVKHARTPGAKIEDVLKAVRADVRKATNDRQTPWDSSSLVGDFYFVPAKDP